MHPHESDLPHINCELRTRRSIPQPLHTHSQSTSPLEEDPARSITPHNPNIAPVRSLDFLLASARRHDLLFEENPRLPPISKQAVEYWLRAAERAEVDTPHAAINPAHVEAFLKLMGAGVLARPLTDAVRIVRSDLRRDGHTNGGLFDRLLLDADGLIQGPQSSFARLQSIRCDAMESVYPVLEKRLENASTLSAVLETAAK